MMGSILCNQKKIEYAMINMRHVIDKKNLMYNSRNASIFFQEPTVKM